MPKRILVLEDDLDQARGMIDLLEVQGYEVQHFEASDEAQRVLDGGARFDAFVFDYSVPPFNSIELIERLGSRVFPPDKVIMITAYENQVQTRREIKTIMVKPNWIDRLIPVLKEITE